MSNEQEPRTSYVDGGEPTVRQVAAEPPVVQPQVAAPVVEPVVVAPAQRVVHQEVLQPVEHRRVATSSSRRIAVDSVIVGIVGVVLLTFGLVAATRAGFDGPMDQPVVEVLGFTATTTLGLIIAGVGLCLLLCAATASRAGAVFFGVVLGVAGFVGAVQTSSFSRTLALESSLAWLAVGAAVLVVLVSLLVPRTSMSSTRVESI